MNFRRPTAKAANCAGPIAESTHIEPSTRISPPSSKFIWGGKFNLRNNKLSPIVSSPNNSAIQKSSVRPKKLDAQIYRDTQSNGLASRVVKYYETSEAKSRPISNQAYRRPGDFPIVNLERKEITLNPRLANAPKISKIKIAPPITLTNQASVRSTIFRTGKNYGDALPIATVSRSNSDSAIGSAKQLGATSTKDNVPIVASTNDYDSNPTRSVLDALKEISRKRIHCDELDGDHVKKQKPELQPNEYKRTDLPSTGNVTKRTRDRVSPTYCSSSAEMQKKRYRNNVILSSLSSSISMNTPKRAMDILSEPLARSSSASDIEGDLMKRDRPFNAVGDGVKQRPSIHGDSIELNAATSAGNDTDIPNKLHATSTPVMKSLSEGSSQQQQQKLSKLPKLTLFNKDYNAITVRNNIHRDANEDDDDYEGNRISFIKPKIRASTIFSAVNKDRTGPKSKLAIMLSCLSGDSKDEVDNTFSTNNLSAIAEDKRVISESLNLSTNTTVTFSTATTTSVLSVPLAASTIAVNKDCSVAVSESEKPSAVSKATAEANITSTNSVLFSIPTTLDAKDTPAASPSSSVTISTAAAIVTSSVSTPINASLKTIPRLGEFSFSATPSTSKIPMATKSTDFSPTTISNSGSATTTAAALSSFSFGKPQTSTTTIATPSVAAPASKFSFGTSNETKSLNKTFELSTPNSTSPQPAMITNAASKFVFGNQTTKPLEETKKNAPINFGLSENNASDALATSKPALFAFGNTAPVSNLNPTPLPIAAATTTTTTATSSSSLFGFSSVKNTSVPTFGSCALNVTTTALPIASTTTTASKPIFAFGNSENKATNQIASTFHFGNSSTTNVTTAPTTNAINTNLFATANTSASTANQSSFSFGAKTGSVTNVTKTTTTTSSIPLFGSNTMKAPVFGNSAFNSGSTITAFGGFNAIKNAATPVFGQSSTMTAFGNANSTSNNPQTAAPTNLFGGTPAAQKSEPTFGSLANSSNATPVFGSAIMNSPPSFGAAQKTATTTPFGSAATSNPTPAFGNTSALNPATPAFQTNTNIFGNASNLQNQSTIAPATNLFGSNANSTQNQPSNGTFGAQTTGSGIFAFGQSSSTQPAAPQPSTITSASNLGSGNNLFGNPSSNTNSAFAFGQSNSTPSTQNNANITSLTAPPAFGGSTSAFNFTATKPNTPAFGSSQQATLNDVKPAFSFSASSNNASNVMAFGSAPVATATPVFGSSNASGGLNSSFSFGSSGAPDASKSFNFGSAATTTDTNNLFAGPATAPAAASTPFSFSAPSGIGSATNNAFQFSATQQAAPLNIFSVGPGNSSTSNAYKGRPIRQATRRMNK